MSRGVIIALCVVGVIVASLAITMLFGSKGIKQAVRLKIGDVNLASVPDGTYRGSYENGRFSNTVEVQVADHKIVSIKAVTDQRGSSSSQQIFDKVLAKQSPSIDAVSGATATTNSYLKAIETALTNAGAR